MGDGAKRLAILGGGMAGLAVAWELTQPGVDHGYESITVYQRGHRLGGKGASSRGPHDRIEEHGLHVWLGYYDNAFRLVRECYDELDRETLRPECPIRAWTDGFEKASDVGVTERVGDGWDTWMGHFTENDKIPGEPGAGSLDGETVLRRCIELLSDFFAAAAPQAPTLYFSASAQPSPLHQALPAFRQLLRSTHLTAFALLAKGLRAQTPGSIPALSRQVEQLRATTTKRIESDPAAQRSYLLIDLISTCLLGMIADGVLNDVHRLRTLDDLDFREWLRRHGAADSTIESGMVRGLYDLVFAYEEGDTNRPAFPAGLGLFLAGKIFFDYKGAIFWKMTAGMGDVVFAPMYEALRSRGVDFEFFHRVEALRLNEAGSAVSAIEMTKQTPLAAGIERYEPLRDFGKLPCFPSRPDAAQLADAHPGAAIDFESHFERGPNERATTLLRGRDFDEVVLATSIGAIPVIAADLVDRLPGWSEMVTGVPTVATQAFQVWLEGDESELGCTHPGATVSGYVEPFDTWASMSHVLRFEDCDADRRAVGTVAYFCSALTTPITPDSTNREVEADSRRVRLHADRFLERDLRQFFPGAYIEGVFDQAKVADLYVRANVDPSDRYVRSQPGSTQARLAPGGSGLTNLVLAGDWTDCGLNAGCIEAATLSGIQAANALLGRTRIHRVIGQWPGLLS